MMRHTRVNILSIALVLLLSACTSVDPTDSSSSSESGLPDWDEKRIRYSAENIASFGSGTPAGVANYDDGTGHAVIWNTDASLDNYGGIQTPMLSLDFSKAVIFEMNVIDCYSQYIIKLAVEGVNENFYVLADEGTTGLISVNVVDSMLSAKFKGRRTSPDPGYENGWWYDGMKKKCSFHILAKGPDGERQTAELVLEHLSIYNDMTAVTAVEIISDQISGDTISALKGSQSIALAGNVLPLSIEEQTILWSSSDDQIASIGDDGLLSFLDVGTAVITAKSRIDQSKSAIVIVDVQSGFENPTALKSELASLTYGGSSLDMDRFDDLFDTTWGENIAQITTAESMIAISVHQADGGKVYENYFDKTISAHVSEAQAHRISDTASFNLFLSGVASATIYRSIGGQLFQNAYSSSLKVAYAFYGVEWDIASAYKEQAIVVTSGGSVYKYHFDVVPSALIGNYLPSGFLDVDEWTIPDREHTIEDRVAHALSPASIQVQGDVLIMKQNKYPEAKYCFGGIVSRIYAIEAAQSMTMLLDVAALNQQSEYVKTMWELKIIYYGEDGASVVSSNPLKVLSGNTIGLHSITFMPTYRHFRIYLVVNGSDIGAQFADAEMRIRSFKMYALRQD